ncbi:MAG: metallopeptidase TldD-related protein [Pseudomonadota bacterium]
MSLDSNILRQLLKTAHSCGADGADAIMLETTNLSISRRMNKPEGIERSENSAIGLRVFVGKSNGEIGQANVSSTDFEKNSLLELAQRAVAMAKIAPADMDSTLPPASLHPENSKNLDLVDPIEPSSDWLLEQCAIAEDTALSVVGITNSEGADASYSKSRITLAISGYNGTEFIGDYEGSHFSISVSVLAGSGTTMERDYDFTSSRHRSDLGSAKDIGINAANRAIKRLNPRKVSSCQVPVVFDPRVSKSLLSILTGSISGVAIARGASFLKDSLNARIFTGGVRIIDDPHLLRGFSSRPFDMEGVANKKTALVEDGVLQTWLLDIRTANKLKMQTTGHASRGISSPPSPSSTNFYMEAGKLSPVELISDIKSGLYLTETFGMGINTITGDYSQGAAGFWIENGEIAYPVSEITIAGNLKDMFLGITPANDLTFRYSTNAPTLRVENMTIAGV